MTHVRGTDVVALREIFRVRGADSEKGFLAALTRDRAHLYRKAQSITWMPVADKAAIFEAAAPVLFPGSDRAMRELGKAMSRITYQGIYQVFMREPTRESIREWTAHIWNAYYDQGKAAVENYSPRGADLVVTGVPDLPATLREAIGGHLEIILEMTGTLRAQVRAPAETPDAWRWGMKWEGNARAGKKQTAS